MGQVKDPGVEQVKCVSEAQLQQENESRES